VASTDQVESFSRADQKLAVGTQVEIPDRGKIAKVEATMEVSDHSDVDTEPFPEITTGKVEVAKSEYGGTVGRVQVNNPTQQIAQVGPGRRHLSGQQGSGCRGRLVVPGADPALGQGAHGSHSDRQRPDRAM
jgi:hypothetical protein